MRSFLDVVSNLPSILVRKSVRLYVLCLRDVRFRIKSTGWSGAILPTWRSPSQSHFQAEDQMKTEENADFWWNIDHEEEENAKVTLCKHSHWGCTVLPLRCKWLLQTGWKKTKAINPAFTKVPKLSSFVNLFRDAFEEQFGTWGILAAVCTRQILLLDRWNPS